METNVGVKNSTKCDNCYTKNWFLLGFRQIEKKKLYFKEIKENIMNF